MDQALKEASLDAPALFLKAIADDDLLALQALVKEHGVEHNLRLKITSAEGDDTVDIEVRGNPLSIAAYQQREALAICLLQNGASYRPAHYSSESWAGWEEFGITPIEGALSFRMTGLAYALMANPKTVDWSYATRFDRDDWGGSRQAPSLFEGLLSNPNLIDFIAELGLFRGLVADKQVEVIQESGQFAVRLEGELKYQNGSMHSCLQWIWDALELKETPSMYPEDEELETLLVALTSSCREGATEGSATQPRVAATALENCDGDDDVPF